MEEIEKKFIKETGLSFDGIPINGVHLEYIKWLKTKLKNHGVIGDVSKSVKCKECNDSKKEWSDFLEEHIGECRHCC